MPPRHTAAKLIHFTPDELAAVHRRAHACGRTPARFIREAALGAIPKARHHEDRDRVLLALARLGGQLSVLASRTGADEQREPDRAALASALAEHRAAIQAVMRSVGRGNSEA
jgi:hypothetical protein